MFLMVFAGFGTRKSFDVNQLWHHFLVVATIAYKLKITCNNCAISMFAIYGDISLSEDRYSSNSRTAAASASRPTFNSCQVSDPDSYLES
jgi:hypothetical protein